MASSVHSPLFLASPRPFSLCTIRKDAMLLNQRIRRPPPSSSTTRTTTTTTFAMRWRSEADNDHHDQQDSSGRIVDENMIVLRKRIRETKMVERNYEPPSEWMDWEKKYYTSYDSIICEAVGILQLFLMNTRPSLAIGMIALVTLSVPTSLFVVISQLMGLTNEVLAGIHLS